MTASLDEAGAAAGLAIGASGTLGYVVVIREQCAWPSSSAAAATLATASIPEMPAGMSSAVY